jgi:hypothetical protein
LVNSGHQSINQSIMRLANWRYGARGVPILSRD